jgi:hypothetical protein
VLKKLKVFAMRRSMANDILTSNFLINTSHKHKKTITMWAMVSMIEYLSVHHSASAHLVCKQSLIIILHYANLISPHDCYTSVAIRERSAGALRCCILLCVRRLECNKLVSMYRIYPRQCVYMLLVIVMFIIIF